MPATRAPAWYTAAWLLLLPLVAFYLCWRALRQREYLHHWAERFLGHGAVVQAGPGGAVLWIHAVSLGETRAARPLVAELLRRHPRATILLTHMTPTGREAGAELARLLPGRVVQRYLPYDLPSAIDRFIRETHPRVGVLMETELWPNVLFGTRAHGVPVVLANARLSERSLAKALRYGDWLRGAVACVSRVGAQSDADLARIARLYAGPSSVTGNVKFDLVPDAAQLAQGVALRARLRAAWGERPVLLFASTREGEERLIVEALRRAAPAAPAPVLLVVPRHPQRFDEVARALEETGRPVLRRARFDAAAGGPAPARPSGAAPSDGIVFLLGDSMGEMPLYYGMADVALIGGSVLPLGGQNLIEACACGCPVLLGPHMFNFAQAADDALAGGAARRVADTDEALRCMRELVADGPARAAMRAAALAFASAHRGATARTVALIEEAMAQR